MSRALPLLYVHATAVWTTQQTHPQQAHPQHAHAHAQQPPAAELLPTRARGRASLLTRMIAEVVAVVAKQGLRGDPHAQLSSNLQSTPLLVGSTLGEIDTTVQLLRMMNEGDGALSPARFQASVHNSAAGQLSIATGNQGFSSCLAAGPGTAAALLIDAYAWLAHAGGSVIVVMADESIPEMLAQTPSFGAAACALLLSCEREAESLASISVPVHLAPADARAGELTPPSPDALSQRIGPSPVAHLLRVVEAAIDAQLTGTGALVELPSGPTPSRAWRVQVKAIEA